MKQKKTIPRQYGSRTGNINTGKYTIHKFEGKLRKLGTVFTYERDNVKLLVEETFHADRCKYCYFRDILKGSDIVADCKTIRDLKSTGECYNRIFTKVKE